MEAIIGLLTGITGSEAVVLLLLLIKALFDN